MSPFANGAGLTDHRKILRELREWREAPFVGIDRRIESASSQPDPRRPSYAILGPGIVHAHVYGHDE
jgi:hypothetical protein